ERRAGSVHHEQGTIADGRVDAEADRPARSVRIASAEREHLRLLRVHGDGARRRKTRSVVVHIFDRGCKRLLKGVARRILDLDHDRVRSATFEIQSARRSRPMISNSPPASSSRLKLAVSPASEATTSSLPTIAPVAEFSGMIAAEMV